MTADAQAREVVSALRGALGDGVVTDPAILREVSTDRSGTVAEGIPLAAVFARSTADVADALRIADDLRIPVVPRGAGTGLAGGARADAGSIVVSTEKMTAIVEVSHDDRVARVQAGVLTADVDAAARGVGLRYTPDPGSMAISTIGGNIATNAGGLQCVKYGVTKDSVLGLEAVLPGGRIVRTGTRTVKGVTGLDLTSLLVGSEGVLAVITEATLRLRPVSDEVVTVVALSDSPVAAAAGVGAVLDTGEVPLVAELLDHTVLRAIDAYRGTALAAAGNALTMLQFDGPGARRAAGIARAALEPTAATITDSLAGGTDTAALVGARRDALPALERLGRVLIEDVAVPPSALAAMVAQVETISAQYDVVIATMAHAGDGNLHPIIVVDGPELPAAAWEAADAVFSAALELGGTLTGEHGVGLLKQRWLRREIDDTAAELMTGIKRVFDPNGIMNPGKAIPVRLPADLVV
ncbi:MAG: FAD-linked oxidase C-terminal domain-containing protein [Gordonia sp. (in: high G+C Gram-positive bacteria)]